MTYDCGMIIHQLQTPFRESSYQIRKANIQIKEVICLESGKQQLQGFFKPKPFSHLMVQESRIKRTIPIKREEHVNNIFLRESCQLRPWAWSHSTLIPGSSPLFSYFRMIAEWWDGARMAGMETGMTSWETSSFRRSWSSPVIPRPSLSFQWDEDTSHSTLIPSGNDPKMRSISF